MSLISVDLPLPETPVTTVITPSGMRTVTSRRLFALAPTIVTNLSEPGRRSVGTRILRAPDRNWPVSERFSLMMSSGRPCATISPPWRPAPGPMSITQSAARIVSSSCSTTITVLPVSRSEKSVRRSRSLSRACRPIDGSSRM